MLKQAKQKVGNKKMDTNQLLHQILNLPDIQEIAEENNKNTSKVESKKETVHVIFPKQESSKEVQNSGFVRKT